MLVTVKLRSKKKREINNFLSMFYETNLDIPEALFWQHEYPNPIEASDIIGAFIDNIDLFNFRMWLCLDKDVYINITSQNGNDVIKYLFERFPY